ncbi:MULTISPECIES: Rpn family recombination-promoting nuclease/putative transposase [unclassified Fibrobacter]|uniref:Rpn family recombination-promoting nuclease/putative transposase n=1 Tax=unclassified Fibrobacter TaxID=2634177 RepID=UPI0009175B8F|nr:MULTISPECIES: Rpn family recombination-promoting nuclease/putative transposase [unclassified Fibrobacter]SHK95508.1 Putative transposase, YhgA-like [Fibrobacter sp. UWH6]
MNTKDHDGIFKTAFKEPKRAASLLKLAAKKNKSLARFLQVVDLKTMRAERTETNRHGLKGSADLAFTLKIKNSNNKAKLFVGLVLEHKSYPDNEVVSQLEHYFYELFRLSRPDCPMVAVIVYNGEIKWNPLKAKLYAKYPEYFHDIGYPFKIEMINVGKEVGDIDFSKLNPYVALTLVAMKYVFNAEKYKPLMDKAVAYFTNPKNKIDANFIQEVLLYLGEESSSEYREAIMDRPEIMAERKRNGFVSVADVIRAEGLAEAKHSAVIKALKRGKLTVEEIAEDNDFPLDEVLKIQKELS